MPVENQANKVLLNGTGSQTEFQFSFKIFKKENIDVFVVADTGAQTKKTLDIDYSVASEDFNLGGIVTLNVAPLATEKVLIIRNIPLEQNADFRPVSGFPEEVITDSFDTSRMIDQDLQEQIDRCLKAVGSSSINDFELPQPDPGKALIWNNEADGLINSTRTVEGIVEDATAQAEEATRQAGIATSKAEEATNRANDAAQSEANAMASELAAASSEQNIESLVNGFDANVVAKTDAFNSNADVKTTAFNDNAAAKQAAVDASVGKAEIWAEGTDDQVAPLGGEHSSKGWAGVAASIVGSGVIDDNNMSTSTTYSSTKLTRLIDDVKNESIPILKNPIDNSYYLDGNETSSTIYSYVYEKGKTVELTFDDPSVVADENIYYFQSFDISRNAIFGGTAITADKIERTNVKVDYQGVVTFEPVEFNGGAGGLKVGAILTGIIDESENKERYLNGGLIVQDQFVSFTNWIKNVVSLYPSLNTTEELWQAELTMSAKGQCGKFVIDDVKGTIRLPKVVNIQGLFDLSQAGVTKEAGLPNITGEVQFETGGSVQNAKGAFKIGEVQRNYANPSGSAPRGIAGFDASLDNPIYGKSTTVQEEAIQYPYYIVVATGSKDSIDVIREAELNNPFTFGMYIYTQSILNNISWLRSNGQYNAKAVYPDFYDWLLKIQNGSAPVEGVSVKLSTESFTEFDYVLNTSVETFRLPIKVKQASGRGVVGNRTVLGLTDSTKNFGIFPNSSSGSMAYIINSEGLYDKPIGTAVSGGYSASNLGIGVTTDPTKSGLETSDEGLYLYFYVGETVQNANLINAGRIEETLASQICVIESKVNPDGSWYRRYSDGWLEQGGLNFNTVDTNFITTTLVRPFKDINYTVVFTAEFDKETTKGTGYIYNKTTTGFSMIRAGRGNSDWYACGQGA